MDKIDTTNKMMVSMVAGGEFMLIMMPARRISKKDALNLAAYIVALADPGGEEFTKVLEAIKNV